jgi:Tol biopolymer transport system component/DNA-binding winged helix-turn-helix (wHTH) protein
MPEGARFGVFRVDARSRELTRAGVPVRLQEQPFQLLLVLLERPGQVVTREELRQRLWPPDTFVDYDDGLNVALRKLRRALGDSAESPRFVETVPRVGYRFLADVQALDAPADTVPAPFTRAPRPRLRARHAALVLVVLLALGGALVAWRLAPAASRARDAPRPLTSHDGFDEHSAAFSPDGQLVAFKRGKRGADAGLYVAQVDGGRALLNLTREGDDCCPAWSPDGRSIAFTRLGSEEPGLYLVPAVGGVGRRLRPQPLGFDWARAHLAWTRDGRGIVFTEPMPGGDGRLAVLSTASVAARPLSAPPPGASDWGPALSPDGATLAFVRSRPSGVSELHVMPTMGGEARRLAPNHSRVLTPPAWSEDGREILFDSGDDRRPAIWRTSLSDDEPRLAGIGAIALEPAVASAGRRLAFKSVSDTAGLRRISPDRGSPAPRRLHAAKGHIWTPRVSPDGRRIAFATFDELWLCDVDGSNVGPLSSLRGKVNNPSWAPDGRTLAFDHPRDGHREVWLVDAAGGAPRPLPSVLGAENELPAWSADGRFVYVSSRRGGDATHVWKVPAEGGTSVRLVEGEAAIESPDGVLYFARTDAAGATQVWRTPAGGGPEERLPVEPADKASWRLRSGGLYFVLRREERPVVHRLDLATGRSAPVAQLEGWPSGFDVGPDGTIVYSRIEWLSQLMIVDGFR